MPKRPNGWFGGVVYVAMLAFIAAMLSCLQMPGPSRRMRDLKIERRVAHLVATRPIAGGAQTAVKCDRCQVDLNEEAQKEHVCASQPGEKTEKLLERLVQLADGLEAKADIRSDEMRELVNADIDRRIAAGDISTPTARETSRITIKDRFDQMGWTRGDFEIGMMLFEASWKMHHSPQRLTPPEDMVKRWRYNVLEGESLGIVDGEKGKLQRAMNVGEVDQYTKDFGRAMDSAETGFGLELIGTEYVNQLWEAARNEDSLVGDIRQIPMTDPTTIVPIDGDLPEMKFVGESVDNNSPAYPTSKTGSNKVTLIAKKFTIQSIWSGELTEDSIIAFVPFLRTQLARSAASYAGSAYYNGDDTNAATGNINLDDADPANTKHYLAWNGIRHYWLVDTTSQGKDMAGVINPDEIWKARGRLTAGDDDIDNLLKTINWGKNPRDLRLIMDWDTFMAMHRLGEVLTVDKYGDRATVVTGELGSYGGIPIISPAYASKTEADGKASDTETNNTKGQITLMNPAGFLGGVRRDMQFFMDRIQRTDQFLIELYTRLAFTRHGENVAAGIFNITV